MLSFKKYPLVRQYDQADCGPAALLSILRYYGGNSSLIYLRELCNTTSKGSTMLDLVNAAKAIGFDAYGAKGKYEDLLQEEMPCIAHVIINNKLSHYVVLIKIDKDGVYIADPDKGKYKLKKEEFVRIWENNAVVLLKPGDKLLTQKPQSWNNWILGYIKKEATWILQSVFLGVVYTVSGLLVAFFIQEIIDRFIPIQNSKKIIYAGLALLIFLLIKSAAGYFRQRFLLQLNKKINVNINSDVISHLFRLPKKYFDTHKTGDITTRVNDVVKIQQSILQLAGITSIDILVIVTSFVFMFHFSYLLAVVALVAVPVYGIILGCSTRNIRSNQNEVMKSYSIVQSTYIDSITGIEDISTFNASEPFIKRNKSLYGFFQEKVKTLGFIQSNLFLGAEISSAIIIVTILILGSLLVIYKSLLLGQMMAVYSLVANIIPSVNRLIEANIGIQGASIAVNRLKDMLLVEKETVHGNTPFALKRSISINNGTFSWPGKQALFTNLDIVIEHGRITSLWGASGSGKSTLVHILQRKYPLQSGRILVDNVDSENINLFEYRRNIGVVSQNGKIFNGTILDNILVGRQVSNLNIVQSIIHRYCFDDFFARFDNGLFTLISEDERHLSGGEKQIIALFRAILENPALLIIDEGLSGLDNDLEILTFNLLSDYAKNNAVLLITHNLKTILKTDYIYFVNKGRIINKGAPGTLTFENNKSFVFTETNC